jgi:uncharacterized membrane protein
VVDGEHGVIFGDWQGLSRGIYDRLQAKEHVRWHFFIGGMVHFASTETEMRIVPSYILWPHEAVLASGVFDLLGAADIL